MGMDPTAKLFYGAVFNSDEIDDAVGWVDKLDDYQEELKELHCPQPYDEYDKKRDDDARDYKYANDWRKWRKKVAEYEKSAVSFFRRGSSEYSELCIGIEGSIKRSYWDDATEVTDLTVHPDWNQKLYDYCAAVGLPKPKLGWYLVAYYG